MAVATINRLLVVLLAGVIMVAPTMAVEVWPDPDLTGGSVRIDGHDRLATCGHAKEHRGPMNAARRDEILTKYGLPPGTHPDYEIDHLIPLCLGGSDDPSNLWAPALHGVEGFGLGSFSETRPSQTTTRPPVVPIAKLIQLVRLEELPRAFGSPSCHPSQRPRLGRVLTNRPAVAFGQSRHWSGHRRMTESDPYLPIGRRR
jgi:hypothetical protein